MSMEHTETAADALNRLLLQRSQGQRPERSSTPTPVIPTEPVKARPIAGACKVCGGAGFVVMNLPRTDPNFGKIERCKACANYLKTCRLTPAEQKLEIDDLRNRPEDKQKYIPALRFLAKEMLRDPYGYLSITGVKGAGKSMVSAALVATFARNGREAVYYTSSEIATALTDFENGDPNKFCERLKRAAVLAIDEMDKIKWTQWVVRTLGDVLDYRHRNAETKVTILTMNHGPEAWPTEEGVYIEHIASRLADGRFNRFWPAAVQDRLPPCLEEHFDMVDIVNGVRRHYVPGLFTIDLPDARPGLRRE